MRKYSSLIFFLLLVFAIGGVASYVTAPEVDTWYQTLRKPSWQPPAYLFGPVWTILYIMIAISGWLVWKTLPTEKFWPKLTSLIMAPYWLQLLLNFLWSIFFFQMHRPVLALVDIGLLATVIGFNIGTFAPINRKAAWLLLPYLLWVFFAASLNAATVFLNNYSI